MTEQVLITGAGGMVGSHIVDYYAGHSVNVVGTYFKPSVNIDEIYGKAKLLECDIRYFSNVYDVMRKYRPQKIFHLAAQSYPTVSWERPQETMEINAGGTINIFESIKRIRAEDGEYDPMVVVACSSAEYGKSLEDYDGPVNESAALLPLHPYGVSKVCQDLLAYQYYSNFSIRCIRARIFNTTGPRKVHDVCSDFTKRVVLLEKRGDQTGILQVGNIDSLRAITDVRDLVQALIGLSEFGTAGEVYNVCGCYVYKIRDIIDTIRRYTTINFTVEVNKELLRPTDEKIISGDSTKLRTATGWKQEYTLEKTIRDMLEYWRRVL